MEYQRPDEYTLRRLKFTASLIGENMLLLDVGCGRGLLSNFTKHREYVGLDISLDQLKSSMWLGSGKYYRVNASAVLLPFRDNVFELVVCTEVIEHLPRKFTEACISEVYRILKKGGTAVFSTPNIAYLYNRLRFLFKGELMGFEHEEHVQFFNYGRLRSMLEKAGFREIRRHGFDVIMEPYNTITRLIFKIPWHIRSKIASVSPLFDQLLVVTARK